MRTKLLAFIICIQFLPNYLSAQIRFRPDEFKNVNGYYEGISRYSSNSDKIELPQKELGFYSHLFISNSNEKGADVVCITDMPNHQEFFSGYGKYKVDSEGFDYLELNNSEWEIRFIDQMAFLKEKKVSQNLMTLYQKRNK